MIKKILLILCIVISIPAVIFAEIKESELANYRSVFLKKILSNNPNREAEIRRCMDGYIKSGSSGIRLLDKFALFLYDCNSKSLNIEKVKFYKDGNINLLIITLKDKSDGSIYSLSLEYTYIPARGSFELSDISFSMIFPDKIKGVSQFFSGS